MPSRPSFVFNLGHAGPRVPDGITKRAVADLKPLLHKFPSLGSNLEVRPWAQGQLSRRQLCPRHPTHLANVNGLLGASNVLRRNIVVLAQHAHMFRTPPALACQEFTHKVGIAGDRDDQQRRGWVQEVARMTPVRAQDEALSWRGRRPETQPPWHGRSSTCCGRVKLAGGAPGPLAAAAAAGGGGA